MVARRSGAVAFGGDQVAHAGGVEFDLGLGCGEKADRLASGQHRLAPAPDLDRRLPILRIANLGEDRFEFVVCLFVGHGLGLPFYLLRRAIPAAFMIRIYNYSVYSARVFW